MKAKIPGIIALMINALSFVLLIGALIVSVTETPGEHGVSRSFALWIYAVIVAMISLIFYGIDAICCIGIAIARRRVTLDLLLILLTIGSIPMVIYVGGKLGIYILIWNAYYLTMFILQRISIIRYKRETDFCLPPVLLGFSRGLSNPIQSIKIPRKKPRYFLWGG